MIIELNFTSRLGENLTMGYLLKSRQLTQVFKVITTNSSFVYSSEVIQFLNRFTPKTLRRELEKAIALSNYRKDREEEQNAHNINSSNNMKMGDCSNRELTTRLGGILYGV